MRQLPAVFFLLLSLSFSASAYARDDKHIDDFAPVGYKLLDSTGGDLNGDRLRDLVVVYHAILEDQGHEGLPRATMILFGQKDGSFKLHARNDGIIECRGCTGMINEPFERITIKGRFVSFEQTFGSANRSLDIVTFKYDKKRKRLILHKHGAELFNVYDAENVEEVFYDQKYYGKASFAEFTPFAE
jgi:hypothetical protein